MDLEPTTTTVPILSSSSPPQIQPSDTTQSTTKTTTQETENADTEDPSNDPEITHDNRNNSKPSKPRPITSCAPCRIRKVKCNRASPCTSCIARDTPNECTYATTAAERSAIAQAELISELRATRNRLQAQAPRTSNTSNSRPGTGFSATAEEAEEEELAALEAVYAVLRAGSWDLVREVVGRVRGGEKVGRVLGGVGI
ncbi:hypothetical protein BJY04DRAFT_214591 [Aspergillus karnatakaensis]|uniref:Zn(II)2Cys6 transcription factor domain-containing protein n=1 Tax=Aspergillus karnatakaensis TaxID=1810916 RepID=UPI003CCCD32F